MSAHSSLPQAPSCHACLLFLGLLATLACFPAVYGATTSFARSTPAPLTSTKATGSRSTMTGAGTIPVVATSNAATPTNNTSTAPTSTGTTPSQRTTNQTMTTSASEGPRWKVRDSSGELCMLMDFSGTIILNEYVQLTILPPNALTNESSCDSEDSEFVLEMNEHDDKASYVWKLTLNFWKPGNTYKLRRVFVKLVTTYVDAIAVYNGINQQDFFEVPYGDYYHCDDFNTTAGNFFVSLTQPIFQPFVNRTQGGDNLGTVFNCGSEPPDHDQGGNRLPVALIVGIVIGSLAVVASIVVTICYVKQRRRPPPYSNMTGEQ